MQRGRLITAAVVALFAQASAVGTAGAGGPSERDLNTPAVGHVVAEGFRTSPDACLFESVEPLPLAANGEMEWIAIAVDDGCTASVAARWEGSLADAPFDLNQVPLESDEPSGRTTTEAAPTTPAPVQSGAVASGCKTSEGVTYMYGFGGTLDKLTNKGGRLSFCWNGTVAWMQSQSGSCWGSDPPGGWYWKVDLCYTSTSSGSPYPGQPVWRTGTGNFHCTPATSWPCDLSNPTGYYHWLKDSETGYPNGFSICGFDWGGQVVQGVGAYVVQGCS